MLRELSSNKVMKQKSLTLPWGNWCNPPRSERVTGSGYAIVV